jgi:hypothetical protein
MSFKSFEKNIRSQFGEDGVIEEMFRRISTNNKICVELGAWDGIHLSNVWNLWNNKDWVALLIEGDKDKFEVLANNARGVKNVHAYHAYVTATGSNSLESILNKFDFPKDIDLVSIDVDGNDYYLFESLNNYFPRIVVIEYNPTIPPGIEIVQAEGEYFGSSALSLLRLSHKKGYKLAHMTSTNMFFVRQDAFGKLLISEPALENVFINNNLTYLISSYDGKTFLAGHASYTQFESMPSDIRYPEIISKGSVIRKVIVQEAVQKPGGRKKLKSILKKTFIYTLWRYSKKQREIIREKADQIRSVKEWKKNGRPAPPPQLYKRTVLKNYAADNGINVFIETGTYLGGTVSYLKKIFKKIISIELDPNLYSEAKRKFSKSKHIRIYQGDSGEVILGILNDISEPCLFWLDGHYSDGITAKGKLNTPILQELDHILNHRIDNHIILIDDARCFTGTDDYPTIEFLENYVRQKKKELRFSVKEDIIRIHK